MKNPFRRKNSASRAEKFAGVGTVFISTIANIDVLIDRFPPEDLVRILKRYITHVSTAIEKHSGVLVRYEGDAVLALWHPRNTSPNHAQLAFDASSEILDVLPEIVNEKAGLTCEIDIVLSTGDMAGDFIGPSKQYQIIGKAVAAADRIGKSIKLPGPSVRMSQFTLELITPPKNIQEAQMIDRDDMEPVRVFIYRRNRQVPQA